jgi:phage gp46-like protein
MSFNRFQGDPAIRITDSGASMEFIGGQPVMDQGLENAVIISLFTKKGFWGNTLVTEESKKIGSDFEKIRTIINIQTINDYTDSINNALKWMKDSGLVNKIDVNVTNPTADQINAKIILYPPSQDALELLFIKNGLNWIQQAQNPAHERFTDVL